jgi:hypothetical protein
VSNSVIVKRRKMTRPRPPKGRRAIGKKIYKFQVAVENCNLQNFTFRIIGFILAYIESIPTKLNKLNYVNSHVTRGHIVKQLVEAVRYKPEGRRFDSRR